MYSYQAQNTFFISHNNLGRCQERVLPSVLPIIQMYFLFRQSYPLGLDICRLDVSFVRLCGKYYFVKWIPRVNNDFIIAIIVLIFIKFKIFYYHSY